MSTSDEEAEMAKLMGFSGFSSGSKPPPASGNKKRKLNTSLTDERAAVPKGIPLGNSKGPNPNLIAVPDTRALRHGASSAAASGGEGEGDPSAGVAGQEEQASAESSGGGEGDTVLEKPLERLTGQDLARLRFGVRLADGRTVFFLPSFLEDPWA
jgi:hypothetical protein